jgi:hypothetical protein
MYHPQLSPHPRAWFSSAVSSGVQQERHSILQWVVEVPTRRLLYAFAGRSDARSVPLECGTNVGNLVAENVHHLKTEQGIFLETLQNLSARNEAQF